MRSLHATTTLAALALASLSPGAHAQSAAGSAGPPRPQVAGAPEVPASPDEIVVTAPRYGEARVGAETEFSEAEIASRGADSVQDLLTRLSPFISADGKAPVILINGRPAGLDRSILAYPAEALARLTVLKPEAASQYGAGSGQRVVNLVLKHHFSSLDADASASAATRGGALGWRGSATRTAIDGDTRWNAMLQVAHDDSLRRSDRHLPLIAGTFDDRGFVAGIGGGAIDPRLIGADGTPVRIAAIPTRAAGTAPVLDDFLATAGQTHPVDPDSYETLQSERRMAIAILGVTRPLGSWSMSLNLTAATSAENGLRGLPMASVELPSGNPFSPFAGEVMLTRPLAGDRALRNRNDSRSAGATLTLGGAIAGWQASVSVGYSRSWSRSLFETGIDTQRVQALLDRGDPDLDPFGPWSEDLLLAARTRSSSSSLVARLSLQRKLFDLPAGPASLSINANANRNGNISWFTDAGSGADVAVRLARGQVDGTLSVNLPISRRGMKTIGAIGDLSADLTLGIQGTTRGTVQKRYSGGMSWSPTTRAQFRAAIGFAEVAPSIDQLDAPASTIVNRTFDYAREAVVDAIWIMGGNPALRRGDQQSLTLNAMLRPLGGQILSMNIGYQQNVAHKGVATFPELTPIVEAAFPDRVKRDATGQLLSVDARSINIVRSEISSLSTGIALRFPVGGAETNVAARPAPNDPLQVSLGLTYNLALRNEIEIRPGLPRIDMLRGSGSLSRHSVGGQLTLGTRDRGVSIDSSWSSATRVSGSVASDTLRVRPPIFFNLSAFANMAALFSVSGNRTLLKDVRLSLDVQNLLNGYRHVFRNDGSIPPGFSRDEVDPIGRTVRISLRKRF